MPSSTWSVAVVGPGGVGGLLGALISRAGHPVFYVATPATVASLGSAGVSVRSTQYGDLNVPATAGRETHSAVDLCLVTVKATGLDMALAGVRQQDLGDGLI
ncbi:MAG: hypothetical protein QOE61_5673, partial [Micromonosporaceae bacterium]|nr:hypothetical protein [Micromonosporaceae bacterium]